MIGYLPARRRFLTLAIFFATETKMAVQSFKTYKCTQCGHTERIQTNHDGHCWSWGRVNTCPKCPPYKKYSEYGGRTIWECQDTPKENNET